MYAVNYTEVLLSGVTQADPTWPKGPCQNGWNFNYTMIPYPSIAAEVRIKDQRIFLISNGSFSNT